MRLPTTFFALAVPIAVLGFSFPKFFSEHLGTASAYEDASPAEATGHGIVHIGQRGDGHFQLFAEAGGLQLPFIVDTGATYVSLTWDTARNLGLVHAGDTMDVALSTANGTAWGKSVLIPKLTIDGIAVENVKAVVVPEGALAVNLLGMSFLTRLKRFAIADNTLDLEQ